MKNGDHTTPPPNTGYHRNKNLQDYIVELEARINQLESKTQKLGTDGNFSQNISAPGFFQD